MARRIATATRLPTPSPAEAACRSTPASRRGRAERCHLVCGTNPNITAGNSTALPAVKVDVAAGALGTYTVSSHVATTTSGVTDPTSGNNDGSDTAQVVSHADLSVAADGPGAAEIAGASGGFDYTLLVANGGPSDNHSDGSGNGYTAFLPLEPGITFSTTGSTAGC